MSIAEKLDAAIKAVCPIHGVSIGRKDDKQTWRVDFKDEATAQQRAQASNVVINFDAVAAEQPDPRRVLDDAECEAAKIDNQIVQFLNMTSTQLDAWVDANITGAGPRTAFKVLGRLAQNAARGKVLR